MKFQISDFRLKIGAIGALAASISVVPTFPPSLADDGESFGGPAVALAEAGRSASAPFSAVVLHAQKIDTKAAADAIMQADRDFNQAVASRDKKRFLSLISESAVFVGDGPMRGHDEILKGWSAFFDPNGPTLSWEPTRADVLVGGDVGVTIGSWIRRTKAADGKTSEARGQYVTTWQKQKDGAWKVVYDIGSTAP